MGNMAESFQSGKLGSETSGAEKPGAEKFGAERPGFEKSEKSEKSEKLDKNVFDLSIAGVPYRVKTSHDAETVQNLVDLVNAKINDALKGTKNGSYQGAAVLSAIHLAEELLQLKKRANQDLKVLEDKLLRLAVDLEKSKLGKVSEVGAERLADRSSEKVSS